MDETPDGRVVNGKCQILQLEKEKQNYNVSFLLKHTRDLFSTCCSCRLYEDVGVLVNESRPLPPLAYKNDTAGTFRTASSREIRRHPCVSVCVGRGKKQKLPVLFHFGAVATCFPPPHTPSPFSGRDRYVKPRALTHVPLLLQSAVQLSLEQSTLGRNRPKDYRTAREAAVTFL